LFDLERVERYIVIVLTVALFTGIGALYYKRSRPAYEVRVEKFSAMRRPVEASLGKVNINKAGPEELMRLRGIGKELAGRIIEYRSTKGLFLLPTDIKNVRGIGPSLYGKIKDDIVSE
jgi:competence ComEA-like helix-hairpin-helix protein